MLKKKEFIRDKGKIRRCLLNECKMTVMEHLYCRVFIWKSIPYDIKMLFKDFINNLKELGISLINIVLLPYFIVLFPFESRKTIQEAKQSVFDNLCYECKLYKSESKECNTCKLVDGKATNHIEIESK